MGERERVEVVGKRNKGISLEVGRRSRHPDICPNTKRIHFLYEKEGGREKKKNGEERKKQKQHDRAIFVFCEVRSNRKRAFSGYLKTVFFWGG